jgi:hypothetical protein
MVKLLLELSDLKWFLRIGLATLFGAGLYVESQGTPFFNDIAVYHSTTSSVIITLVIIAFIQPFIKVKKKDDFGGEIVLKKLSAVVIILLAVIAVTVYMAVYQPGAIGDFLEGTLGGVGVYIIEAVQGIQASATYQLYGLPIGFAAGIVTLYLVAWKVWPRIHRTTAPQKQYQGPPQYVPGSVIQPQGQEVPQKQEQKVVAS